MWNACTHMHTHIHTALRQAGGISLLLIIIMKRLHVEHLPLRAQHDCRSVPPTSLRSHTHSQLLLQSFFTSSSSPSSSTPDNIYQTPGAPSGHPSLCFPFYPSRFLGEPGVWGVPGSSAGLHRCLFLPKQTDGKRERDSQLGWCAVWQRGLSYRSPFFFFVLHLNILPLITHCQYNTLSTVFSLSQHTLVMAALLI